MALRTIDNWILEIAARLGGTGVSGVIGTGEASGNPPLGRIEREINNALMDVVLGYRLAQFEADPSWYFKTFLYSTGTASASALGVTITGSGTGWVSGVEPPTTVPTLAAAAFGGAGVDAGTHTYRATYVTAAGETLAGPVSAVVTTTGANDQVNLTVIPTSPSDQVTSRKIYRSAAGYHEKGPWKLVTTIANNTATTYSDTTPDASLGAVIPVDDTANNAEVGWLFRFDSDSTYSEIIGVDSTTSLRVTPRIASAKAAGSAYTIIRSHWPMPTAGGGQLTASPSDVFSIFDVRDAETMTRIKPADMRMLDRTNLSAGNPTNYVRWKDKLFLWPAPDVANVYYRCRYLQRPEYRAYGQNPARTLAPLPEEWQEVVVLLAFAQCLAATTELERASFVGELAQAKADRLMRSYAEEAEDKDNAFKPSPLWIPWHRDR